MNSRNEYQSDMLMELTEIFEEATLRRLETIDHFLDTESPNWAVGWTPSQILEKGDEEWVVFNKELENIDTVDRMEWSYWLYEIMEEEEY